MLRVRIRVNFNQFALVENKYLCCKPQEEWFVRDTASSVDRCINIMLSKYRQSTPDQSLEFLTLKDRFTTALQINRSPANQRGKYNKANKVFTLSLSI